MSSGSLKLSWRGGIEEFVVREAQIRYCSYEPGRYDITFSGETSAQRVKLGEGSENVAPNFDFTLVLKKPPQAAFAPGASFQIPKGCNPKTHDYWTRLYYFEHEEVDDVTISIISRANRNFRAAIVGSTIDPKSGPPDLVTVSIDAEFALIVT